MVIDLLRRINTTLTQHGRPEVTNVKAGRQALAGLPNQAALLAEADRCLGRPAPVLEVYEVDVDGRAAGGADQHPPTGARPQAGTRAPQRKEPTMDRITLGRLLRDVQARAGTRAGKTISTATAEKLQACITALETADGGLTDAVELLTDLLETADGGDDEEEETDTTRSTGLPRREIERARAQGLVIEEIPL